MRKHKQLLVWQEAVQLVSVVYRLSSSFPDHERFGLTAQIRRAAVSIPSNIAEGVARSSLADYLRFLAIARGSLSELDTQLVIAENLGYMRTDPDTAELIERLFGLLNGLIRSIEKKQMGQTA